MIATDNSVSNWLRYESKYLISEKTAARIRSMCCARMPLDPYSARCAEGGYPICSTYLDTPDLQLHQQTVDRSVERFKLRVRTYDHHATPDNKGPQFFEIKRKSRGVVHKLRARVQRSVGAALIWGNRSPLATPTSDQDLEEVAYLNEFLGVRDKIGARPILGVSYTREAFEAEGIDRVRVTFDRNLHYGLIASTDYGKKTMWWPVETGGVILEIKFTNTFPFWIADMVRREEVQRRGICKYTMCLQSAGIKNRASA